MAKSGGMLNAICAKLLKTTNPSDTSDEGPSGDQDDAEETTDADVENNNAPNIKKPARSSSGVPGALVPPDFRHGASSVAGRKSRRKNQAPRNIAQLHEEDEGNEEVIEKYEVELDRAQVIHMPTTRPLLREFAEDVEALDLSSAACKRESLSLSNSSSSVRIETSAAEEYTMDVTGALDLSLSKGSNKSSDSQNSISSFLGRAWDPVATLESESSRDSVETFFRSAGAAQRHAAYVHAAEKAFDLPAFSSGTGSSDATDMKNYARELLSLYGVGKQEAESITESVSLENFASGNILARQMPMAHVSLALAAVSGRDRSVGDAEDTSADRNRRESSLGQPGTTSPEDATDSTKLQQGAVLQDPVKMFLSAAAAAAAAQANLQNHPNNARVAAVDVRNLAPAAESVALGLYNAQLLSVQGKIGGFAKVGNGPSLEKGALDANSAKGKCEQPGFSGVLPDHSKYVKRFASFEDCKDALCRDLSYKEHFHCVDCNFKVFTKKEEMIRHFKWHKKREESLQHGFLRFSPLDDCAVRFQSCLHNGKQTHYHCVRPGCSKVYVSTSDVQMHSNYHKKDLAIIQEGFQRFRATEDCGDTSCSFYGQRTTHFHCRRPACKFTFKNKADMEKHKAYHQKDEAFARDGFKKFMKYETCNFSGCKYSKAANHIHCIRPGCDYVLHSTGQLNSHKRKHERRDHEHAYRRFKEEKNKAALSVVAAAARAAPPPPAAAGVPGLPSDLLAILSQASANRGAFDLSSFAPPEAENPEYIDMEELSTIDRNQNRKEEAILSETETTEGGHFATPDGQSDGQELTEQFSSQAMPSTLVKLASKLSSGGGLDDSLNLPIPDCGPEDGEAPPGPPLLRDEFVGNHGGIPTNVPGFVPKGSPAINNKKEKDETWKKYLTRYTANDPCHPRCDFLYKDHYHCNNGGCGLIFRSKDGVREHGRCHEQQDRITSLSYRCVEEHEHCDTCPTRAKHFHCLWASCSTVVQETDQPFTRLNHHKSHEYARATANRNTSRPFSLYKLQTDAFRRRRGRPPKYPKNDIPLVPKIDMSDADISGTLAKLPGACASSLANGFLEFSEGRPCADDKCYYQLKRHFHCVRPRCHLATDNPDALHNHAKDFHNFITILDGFEFFDRSVNCRRPHCHNNKANKHYHCTRPRCDYSFVRHSTMAQHDKKHRLAEMSFSAQHEMETTPDETVGSKAGTGQDRAPLNVPSNTGIRGTTMVSPLQSPVTITPPPAHTTQVRSVISPGSTDKDSSLVKTKGTYFPMSGLSPQAVTAVSAVMAKLGQGGAAGGAPVLVSQATNQMGVASKLATSSGSRDALPLTVLLQQNGPQSVPPLNWSVKDMTMHYDVLQNCGRPFCKLKKRDHYHCLKCQQAFSEPVRLRSHVAKHNKEGLKMDRMEKVHQPMLNPALVANPALKLPLTAQAPWSGGAAAARDSRPPLSNANNRVSNIKPEDVKNYRALSTADDDNDEFDEEEDANMSSSLNLNPSTFSSMLSKSAKLSMSETTADNEGVRDGEENGMDLSKRKEQESDEVALVEYRQCGSDEEREVSRSELVSDADSGEHTAEESTSMDEDVDGDRSGDAHEHDRRSSRKRSAPKHADFIDSAEAFTKQRRLDAQARRASASASPPKSRSSPRAKVIEQSLESRRRARGGKSAQQQQQQQRLAMIVTDVVNNNIVPAPEENSENATKDPDLEGFKRFTFGEECGFPKCSHRLGSHWHCTEKNCSQGLNDRTRAAAHAQKHASVRDLVGGDFEHHSARSQCGRADCEHALQAAHFHCGKCEFATTITHKVKVHRRHHEREEYIAAAGFAQFSGMLSCAADWCTYSTKQTHYHCVVPECRHSTVGLAQMQAHKSKKHDAADDAKQ